MRDYLVAYVSCAIVMAVLDFAWLSTMVGLVYRGNLPGMLSDSPNLTAAVAFYLLYIVGILIFAVRPSLINGDWKLAALYGALFGFFAYATYDLTNLATLKVWSLRVSLIDMAWGTVLTATAASTGSLAVLKLLR